MTCPSCGQENREGRKFCAECGSGLASGCPSCGAANEPGEKFCGECGSPLAAAASAPATPQSSAPAAERRLVSVLFADLVGFTTASEGRDAEDTRELLSQYFDTSRSIIERYGGTVEKFIGDAVMAVWGTPVATEDDAERAVRAALELVSAIPELHPDLRARAGVLTGEAAVTIGAESEGMVAGDLVNTASRVQSAAEPGTVLVGESTRAAADAAIAFEDAGAHEMKGKAEPMRLWRALRVVANRGGEGRSSALEAPFVGRDRELRVLKDLYESSAEERRAHLVLVTGTAGTGKSRVSWEFEKYLDGLAQDAFWHKGRSPSYGEGIAYWALAEMVRGRAGIVEGEDSPDARAKLSASVVSHVASTADREWVEPRLAHLLGLVDGSFERDDLFAAWRLFFESLADESPTILVFEDLQWADAGLLEFVEYLVEWARTKPIFVIGLARLELLERRPGFGATTRGGFTALTLEPLPGEAMGDLLDGLVPGLPETLRDSIRTRAEGIPLYAVETVRMLLNRGQLEPADGSYRVVGEIDQLAVPETLHALVASRIDGLDSEERRLVQDASVLGKTFVVAALASVAGTPQDTVETTLQSLVRKEIVFLESDPRSAERGQYGFLQDLVRRVAYETLARRDRKARHLAAAEFFEAAWAGRDQEVVEVVASHYLTALELEPDAADAGDLRAKVLDGLTRAGERAASLGANAEAVTWFARAAELVDDPAREAELLARAGTAARRHGDMESAARHLTRAIELYEEIGDRPAAARVSADLAGGEFAIGKLAEALERLERAYSVLEREEPDADLAFLLSQLGRWQFFAGNLEQSAERNERALDTAERLRLPEVISHALNTKGLLEASAGHWETARALLRRALEIAVEHDLPEAASRGYGNLGFVEARSGNYAVWEDLAVRNRDLARRVGDRENEWFANSHLAEVYFLRGKWEDVAALVDEIPPDLDAQTLPVRGNIAEIARHRRDSATARDVLDRFAPYASSASLQDRAGFAAIRAAALLSEEKYAETMDFLAEALVDLAQLPGGPYWLDLLLAEVALSAGEVDRAADVLGREALARPDMDPISRAQLGRFRACVAAARGDAERADEGFKQAAAAFREWGTPFYLACTELEHAEWLVSAGRADEAAPLVAEVRETFERLRTTPWLERADALAARLPSPAAA